MSVVGELPVFKILIFVEHVGRRPCKHEPAAFACAGTTNRICRQASWRRQAEVAMGFLLAEIQTRDVMINPERKASECGASLMKLLAPGLRSTSKLVQSI